MNTSRAVATPPWGTGVIVALNVGLYLVAGSADDYRLISEAQGDVPSIGRLVADVVRHDGIVSLVIVILFLVPSGWRLERVIGALGVASTYLVGGFVGGFVEVLGSSDGVTVVGATAGATTLLFAWAQTHWRLRRTLMAPAVVLLCWFSAHAVMMPGTFPAAGMAVAVAVGLYATKSVETEGMTEGAR